MRIMSKKFIVKVWRFTGNKAGIMLFTAMLAMTLFCMSACSSKEAILLEDDNLVHQDREETDTDIEEQQVEQSTLFVHICGEVEEPGVYELPVGSRIFEAVEAAGGFTLKAETGYVNLAQQLEDGYMIRIPSVAADREEAARQEASQGVQSVQQMTDAFVSTGADDGLVDINSADKQELCTIPGVGESRAESIIAYREKNGGFKKIEDIMNVEGIKDGMFAKMKDKICVRGVE